MPVAIYLACNFLLLILQNNFLFQYECFFLLISPVSAGSYGFAHSLGKQGMLEIGKWEFIASVKDVEKGVWHKQGKNSQLQCKFEEANMKIHHTKLLLYAFDRK